MRLRGVSQITYADVFFNVTETGNAIIAGIDNISTEGGSFSVIDSRFFGVGVLDFNRPSNSSYIERNVFENNGAVYAHSSYQYASIYVTNNAFYGNPLNAYSSMEQKVFVTNNSFTRPYNYALELTLGSTTTSGTFSAPTNYWGTNDSEVIRSLIYDGYVNGGYSDYVDFEPYLENPHPSTPEL
jgi:hypothetical protein